MLRLICKSIKLCNNVKATCKNVVDFFKVLMICFPLESSLRVLLQYFLFLLFDYHLCNLIHGLSPNCKGRAWQQDYHLCTSGENIKST